MTDKLTDSEIVKALPKMLNGGHGCKNCKYDDGKGDDRCGLKGCNIARYALDLINRLQAKAIKEQNKNSKLRNERNRLQAQNKDLAETVHNLTIEKDALFDKVEELKVEIERLKESLNIELENFATEYDNKIKAEAYKEFAEKAKEFMHNKFKALDEYEFEYITESDIDNLAKEMVGDDNA